MAIRSFITKMIWLLPPPIRDDIRNLKRCTFYNRKYPPKQLFIQVIDGSSFHGGLTDRFKGIISSYLFCKINGIEFKIAHTSPFNLSLFLECNTINWQLGGKDEITKNIFETKLMYLIGDSTINRFKTFNSHKQIHCFSNRDITESLNNFYETQYSWGNLFNELFKPTNTLKAKIKQYQIEIGENYYSAVFRFQNLLGDFIEYNDVKELSEQNKEKLLQECKSSILNLKEKLYPNPILLTSDSKYFLEFVNGVEGIITFPEDIVHIDNSPNYSDAVYQKSLIDFYLISESVAIYSIGTSLMYKTEFPLYAAKLHNIPFNRIELPFTL